VPLPPRLPDAALTRGTHPSAKFWKARLQEPIASALAAVAVPARAPPTILENTPNSRTSRLDPRLHLCRRVDRGFSLIEVLVASALMVVALAGLAQLAVASVLAGDGSRAVTLAAVLASQKIEQLRALAWTVDAAGAPVSDTATDTSRSPERPAGGTGLAPSPPDALVEDTSGYCDYLDGAGRSLGGGSRPPAGTVFVRRWSIQPLAGRDGVVMTVSVTRAGAPPARARRVDEARLVAVKVRKAG